jgi:hypothetical protein
MEEAQILLVVGGGGAKVPITTPVGFAFLISFLGFWLAFMTFGGVSIVRFFRSGEPFLPNYPRGKDAADKRRLEYEVRNKRNLQMLSIWQRYLSTRIGVIHINLMILFFIATVVFGIWMLAERKQMSKAKDQFVTELVVVGS